MKPAIYFTFLQQAPLLVFGILVGILLSILVGRYQGIVEVQVGRENSYFRVESHLQCPRINQPD